MNYHDMADELLKIALAPTPEPIFGPISSAVPPANLGPKVPSSRVAAVKGPTVPGARMVKGLARAAGR